MLDLGDIVVSVNGQNLAGLSRQEASTIIKNCIDVLDLVVLRGMGWASWLAGSLGRKEMLMVLYDFR